MRPLFGRIRFVRQDPEKSKQAHGDFFDLIVGQVIAEFVLVNGLELVNGLTAQLLWRFHATYDIRLMVSEKEWEIGVARQFSTPSGGVDKRPVRSGSGLI